MTTDRNGMSHKAAGTVGGGRFERKTGAGSDDDLTVDLSDATIDEYGDLVDVMRPARPGESDDRPLAYAFGFPTGAGDAGQTHPADRASAESRIQEVRSAG